MIAHSTAAQHDAHRRRPDGQPVVMYQSWQHLLFLHWRVPAAAVQRTLPDGLTVDTHGGHAYLGVVPFFMRHIRPRYLPEVGRISNFLEANVRTYVVAADGTPGVWFYSLDASQPLAVLLARLLYQLPYFRAEMTPDPYAPLGPDGLIDYTVRRRGGKVTSRFTYAAAETPRPAEPGSLAHFLVERYVLFAQTTRGLAAGRVFHAPYTVAPATVARWDNVLATLAGFTVEGDPVSALFSPGVSVDVYPLRRLAAA